MTSLLRSQNYFQRGIKLAASAQPIPAVQCVFCTRLCTPKHDFRFSGLPCVFLKKCAKPVDTATRLLYYSPNIDSSRLATAQVLSPSQYLDLYNCVPQGHATILNGVVVCPFLYAIKEN